MPQLLLFRGLPLFHPQSMSGGRHQNIGGRHMLLLIELRNVVRLEHRDTVASLPPFILLYVVGHKRLLLLHRREFLGAHFN